MRVLVSAEPWQDGALGKKVFTYPWTSTQRCWASRLAPVQSMISLKKKARSRDEKEKGNNVRIGEVEVVKGGS